MLAKTISLPFAIILAVILSSCSGGGPKKAARIYLEKLFWPPKTASGTRPESLRTRF